MRNLYLFLLIAVFAGAIMSAQVKIGENPQNIDPSSVLELESTDKVLVITRVTTTQMNAIIPIQGALCYNTDLQSVHYYDGTQWVNIGGSGTEGPLTADAIVNQDPTIVISPTATGDNLEVLPESITSAQIKDGTITGTDMADGSIGPGKLQDQSVTIDKLSDNIDVSVFRNDAGYITSGEVIVVSGDLDNAITADIDGRAFYDDSGLMNDILNNTQAINDIGIPNLNEVLQEGNNALNLKIVGLADPTNPADATNKQYVDQEIIDAIAAGGGNPTDELIQDGEVIGNDLIINEGVGANAQQITIDVSALNTAGGTTEVIDGTTLTGIGTPVDPFKIEPGATGQILTTSAAGVVWANAAPGGGSTEEADQITITGVGTNVDPFKIEPGATGQILTTSAAGVVWANAAPGGGSTEEADQITITGVGTNADPFKIEPSPTVGQYLRTTATGVVWDEVIGTGVATDGSTIVGTGVDAASELMVPTDGITTTEIANGTIATVDVADANITPIKIEPSLTNGQFLRTDATGNVIWDDLPVGTGGAVTSDGLTITGTGADVASALSVPVGGIATAQIADGTILAEDLNNMGATNGQVLKWNDASTSWVTAADDTGAAALSDGNIFVGDAANTPQDVALTGDATIDNLGALTIADDAITLAKINQNAATDGQVLKWDDATTSWVTAADDAGLTTLTDGNIFVGDATNAPQDVTLSGDATIDNLGALTIADDAITLAKINQNAATDGQVLKWDDATTSWVTAADDAGLTTLTDGNIFVGDATNAPQDVTLSGDATIDNLGALTIADDAITTAKIENATILAEDLNDMGATVDGDILKWNTALGVGGGWEVGANAAAHTGTPNEIFFAGTGAGTPTGTNGLVWNPIAITGGFPAMGIGLDGRAQSTKAKVHIDEELNGAGDISYGLQLQNRGNVGNSSGIIFAVNPTSENGKGALLYERTGAAGVGDFHFLQAPTAGTANPGLTDKAFTITNDKDLGIYRAIGIGATGTDFGLNNQVLASGGPGNPAKWVNAGGGGDNLSTVNLVQPAADLVRTYDITNTNQSLVFTGLGNVGIGNTANPPQNKLHVGGAIRSEGILNSDGNVAEPSYRFTGDTNTGMFWRAADDIGFTAGGAEAMSVARPTPTAETRVIINENLELDGALLDKDGDAGTAGQVLSSTATGTDWVAPSGPTQKGKVSAIPGNGGIYDVTVTGQTTANYVINVSVLAGSTAGPTIIQVLGQTINQFTVQIFEFNSVTGAFVLADYDWFYTIHNP